MGEIEEIHMKGEDVKDAKLFYYRGEDRKIRKFAKIALDGRELVVPKTCLTQLLRYCGLKTDVFKLPRQERDKVFFEAVRGCRELVISHIDGKVIRVATPDFVAIPHRVVLRAVRETLKGNYETEDIETDGGMFARWTLRSIPSECTKLGGIVSWNLWVYNKNDAQHALKIGGGFTVLACQNGAIRYKHALKIRVIHRGEFEDVVNRIREAVDVVVNKELPTMAYLIDTAASVKADMEIVKKLIRLYPHWIQIALLDQLRTARTWWDVSNAFSYVATHRPVTENQRIELSNMAVEVLELSVRR